MSLQELIELAILDAMGLLDEDERVLFERAFQAAAPAVQSQVRREQTRLSQIDMLLPDVAPPAGLRAIVLQAVRDEMARSASSKSRDLVVPALVPSRGVSPLWRAASVGLLAAVLVLGVTMFLFQTQHQRLAEQLQANAIEQALIDELGSPFVMDVLFDRDTERIQFVAEDPGFRGVATIMVNPEWNEARFFCKDITTPPGRSFRLAIVDEDDKIVQELAAFTSNGGLENKAVPMRHGLNGTIAIIASGEGNQMRIVSRARLHG